MDNKGVLRADNLLDQHSHKNLVKADANLLDCKECSLVEFGCPNLFDCIPCLRELLISNSKLQQKLLDLSKFRIGLDEGQGQDNLLATNQST